mgnify:CR=1 FL=1
MDAQGVVSNGKPLADLGASIGKGKIIGKINMFFFESTDKAFSKSILCRLSCISHTDLDRSGGKQCGVFPGRILYALV